MIAVGLALVALGLPFALNTLRVADRLAVFYGQYPWWLRSPGINNPASWRFMGGGFIATGVALLALSLRS